MGLLNRAKCYMACQLQFGDFDKVRNEHEYFRNRVEPMGVVVLSPLEKIFTSFDRESKDMHEHLKEELAVGNFNYVRSQMQIIRNRDLAACDLSTFIVAKLNPKVVSYGIVDEIITSRRNGRPVFLVIEGKYKNCPLWLCSYFKSDWVYNDYDEVIDKLIKIDKGEESINSKNWKILEEQYR